MRRRRGFRLTDIQAQILITLIIVMLIVIAVQAAYIFYLKMLKSRVDFEIVEIQPPKVEVVTPQSTSVTEPSTPVQESTPDVYEVKEFDYQELLNEAVEVIPQPPVSVFVVSADEALKIVKSHEGGGAISRLDDDTYTVVLKGEVRIPGLMAQKSVYGVHIVAYYRKEPALEKVRSLRREGYPSYVSHFKREYRDIYSVVLGLFPTVESAERYRREITSEPVKSRIKEITGIRSDNWYVGWVVR